MTKNHEIHAPPAQFDRSRPSTRHEISRLMFPSFTVPSGCSFKHARLLEEDGMRVLTTSLADNEFIFGGQNPLEEVLRYAEDTFSPKRMAVIGTCVAMIIGEDLQSAIDGAAITTPTIAVDIHAGYPENIAGVLRTLEAAEGVPGGLPQKR